MAAAAVVLGACTSPDAAAPPATTCDPDPAAHLDAAGVLPAPADPLLPAPLLYPDDSLPGYPGVVVDPAPLARGDHPVLRYFLDPVRCELAGGPYMWAPPPPGADATPATRLVGRTENASATLHALLVTSPDPGADADLSAWHDALLALGAGGVHLHAPTRTDLEQALATRLCFGLGPGDTALLVTAGRGLPTQDGGGAFLLGDEAISYGRLATQLGHACAQAGLIVWVADASHAGAASLPALQPGRAGVLWRASDAAVPDAPRLDVHGGGALGRALADHLADHAGRRCLAATDATPGELLAAFTPPAAELRARMAALRWDRVAEPALAAAGLGAGQDADTRARLAALLDAQLPYALTSVAGEPLEGGRCVEAGTCIQLGQGCGLTACERWQCIDGHCVPGVVPGRDCDDGNPCTKDDVCSASGHCQGAPRTCDDGNPCTVDGCEDGLGCVSVPRPGGGPCDDGDACTQGDTCDDDGLCVGAPVTCDDGDPCTKDACDPAEGCTFTAAKLPCDDGDPCTHLDFCLSGTCRGLPVDCDDGEPCTLDACDSATGECAPLPLPDGAGCSDGDVCTAQDRCLGGVCTGLPLPCDDGLPCTLDLCDQGICTHLPMPGTCATAAGCIPVGQKVPGDPCQVCQATAKLAPVADGAACADDGVPCTADFCSGGVCVHPNQPGTCTGPDGQCVQVGESLAPCLVCSATGVGSPAGFGAPCDDGDPCTDYDACTAEGACVGAPRGCCPSGPEAECGVQLTGDLGDPAFPAHISDWSCLPGVQFFGTEHAHPFVSPCAGTLQLTFTGPPGALLFVLRGDLDQCGQAQCTTYTGGPIAQPIAEGEAVTLIVDGQAQVPGPYTIDLLCPCDPVSP